ncbi:hypothetical protein F5I97DRAFT_1829705 [Phlebopus sp. FC_14]|nr:hypothetical protein F5I97DRAFT_1829705 [Phlebopus sp. FC_14]
MFDHLMDAVKKRFSFTFQDKNHSVKKATMVFRDRGKTVFFVYALIERLRERMPVAFQYYPDTYLFTEDSVTIHSEDLTGVWALSDSNAGNYLPFIAARTVCTDWTKQYDVQPYITAVWIIGRVSWPCFTRLATSRTILGFDIDQMIDLASKWGPNVRTLLELPRGVWNERALLMLSSGSLENG